MEKQPDLGFVREDFALGAEQARSSDAVAPCPVPEIQAPREVGDCVLREVLHPADKALRRREARGAAQVFEDAPDRGLDLDAGMLARMGSVDAPHRVRFGVQCPALAVPVVVEVYELKLSVADRMKTGAPDQAVRFVPEVRGDQRVLPRPQQRLEAIDRIEAVDRRIEVRLGQID